MKTLLIVMILSLTLAVGACTPTTATRGNNISETKFPLVQANKSTRADVLQAWGPPTINSPFDANTWYYIGETTAQRGIYAPEVTSRRIIRVKFDTANNDTVTEVADLNTKDGREIDFVGRKTPSAGKEYTALQQFIGNLGKYNSNADKK